MPTTCLSEPRTLPHPDDLARRISLLRHSESDAAGKLTREYVMEALGMMSAADSPVTLLRLSTATLEAAMRLSLPVAGKAAASLASAISIIKRDPCRDPRDLILPLLTLGMYNADLSLQREATRIINRSYRRLPQTGEPIPHVEVADSIHDLHTAVTFSEYVSRFSIRRIARCWDTLATRLLSSGHTPAPRDADRLLKVADRISPYADLSPSLITLLKNC